MGLAATRVLEPNLHFCKYGYKGFFHQLDENYDRLTLCCFYHRTPPLKKNAAKVFTFFGGRRFDLIKPKMESVE